MCQDRENSIRQPFAGTDPHIRRAPFTPDPDDSGATAAMRELSENPALKSKLLQGMQVPLEECIPEDEVVW